VTSAEAVVAAAPVLIAVSGVGCRILVVEDNRVNQRVAEVGLTKMGYRVVLANDGQECLDLLTRESFDLILMDMHMPVMGGLEATRAIRMREREHGGHVPIVALTASALKSDQDQCRQAGMDEFVAKPIQVKVLRAVVARLLAASAGVDSGV
jgi:CheY-like chemotaxis protein